VFALCISINTSNAQVNVKDSLALVDLYNNTNGPNWTRHDNWLTKGAPVGAWYGISVTPTRVSWINLSFNNLIGSLPSSLSNLAELGVLDLTGNKLSGSIPTSFGNLVKLSTLALGANQLSGSIPNSLANLVNLQSLELFGNQLSGSIPFSFGNLINLSTLQLGANQLSGSIPSSLGNCTYLGNLGLYNNQFSGSIPSSLGKLTNFTYLLLSYNQLSGSIPSSFGNLVNLSSLQLNGNQLSGSIPSSLGNIVARLDYLDLSHNQLSGGIPSSLGNLVNLRYLGLNNNLLSGRIPSSLGNLVHLSKLYLDHNQLSGMIPSSLGNLLNLHSLYLNGNHFTFDGMESIAQTFPNAIYAPQKLIPVHQNGNTLSVYAGGTLSNNTYTWFFKNGQIKDTIVIKGDSVFHPKKSGTYRAKVTNSIAIKLQLHSDTIVYTAPAVVASAQNALQQYNKTNLFLVYPNPAKDILFVQTNSNASFSLLNQSGKILVITNINGKGSINISGIAAGLYYLKNNSTDAVQKVVIAR